MAQLDEYVGLRGDDLLGFCARLTGDPDEAADIAAAAAQAATSRAVRRGDVGADAAVWRAAVQAYVRSRTYRSVARTRAVLALRDHEGLGIADIAALLHRPERWVERRLHANPTPKAMRAHSGHRRHLAIALSALVLLPAAGGVVWLRQRSGPEEARLPGATGLLPWAPRGPLGLDRGLHRAATRAWAASDHRVLDTSVLWGGRVGGGRLAVVEAQVDRVARVATIGELHGRFEVLDSSVVSRLTSMLVIDYAGPEGPPVAADGTRARVLRALVAPGVQSLQRRGAAVSREPSDLGQESPTLGGWKQLTVSGGITDSWLDFASGPTIPLTALREDFGSPGLLLSEESPMAPTPVTPPRGQDADAYLGLAQVLHEVSFAMRLAGPPGPQQLYVVQSPDFSCIDCPQERIFAVFRTVDLGLVVREKQGFATARGSVVLFEGQTVRLLGPPSAVACSFGSDMPDAPAGLVAGRAEDVVGLGSPSYDGSFVCVDATGHVVDSREGPTADPPPVRL